MDRRIGIDLRPQVNSILWYKRRIAELEEALSYAATNLSKLADENARLREELLSVLVDSITDNETYTEGWVVNRIKELENE